MYDETKYAQLMDQLEALVRTFTGWSAHDAMRLTVRQRLNWLARATRSID